MPAGRPKKVVQVLPNFLVVDIVWTSLQDHLNNLSLRTAELGLLSEYSTLIYTLKSLSEQHPSSDNCNFPQSLERLNKAYQDIILADPLDKTYLALCHLIYTTCTNYLA